MTIAYGYDDKGYFTNEQECQIDPLNSQAKGYTVFLLPGNATYTKPLEAKEGYKIKYNKDEDYWEYEEEKKEEEPQAYVPTEKDNLNSELWRLKGELQQLDYIGIKIATGRAKKSDYTAEIAHMNELAKQIDEVEAKIAALTEEEAKAE